MDTVTGYIDHVIYRNEENGYTVLTLGEDAEELTCVGIFQYVSQGERIEARGQYIEHPLYGKQFQVQSYETKTPEDALAMERYLASGAIKGVGAALAARIVKKFGDATFRVLEEEPERLVEVKGISERIAREIARQVEEKSEMQRAMLFLQKYGISLQLGVKIFQQYGQELYRIIQENPYRMAEDISGVGFKTADEIAVRAGIRMDSDYRIRSGLCYVLQQAMGEGHTYLPEGLLLARAKDLLGTRPEDMEKYLMDLAIDKKLVLKEREQERLVYGSQNYFLELNTARMLKDLNFSESGDEGRVQKRLSAMEKETGIVLDEQQRMAVRQAARKGIMILTGGPGTGKTTTINAMIRYFEGEDMEIRLAAPTGRAAKRMTEATGYEAQTIHRMLELTGGVEDGSVGGRFERNAQNPLEADLIIIDEMSMVDIYLMHSLLNAVVPGTRLILVGDVDQLPSVGPGNVLRDIIASKAFAVVELHKIFRQASQSDIVVNAHKINRGEPVTLDNKSRDFFFLERKDADVIIRVLIALILEKLPRYVEAKPWDIQVLTPMRKGLLGVERLNLLLQKYLNPAAPEKKEWEHGQSLFRQGDKVMQIKNNYQATWEIRGKYGIVAEKGVGIFNGDTGMIRDINEFSETMTVEFDEGRFVEYPFKQLEELELAYAVTIHKSQGSEYPAVILPLLSGPRMLMNRNLLYTAVTRAKKCVTMVGSADAVRQMIENEREQKRFSTLDLRIQELEELP